MLLFPILSLLLALVGCALALTDQESVFQSLQFSAEQRVREKNCLSGREDLQTDTRVKQTGLCDASDKVQYEAVVWPHCEGSRCAAIRMRPLAAVTFGCDDEVTVKCL